MGSKARLIPRCSISLIEIMGLIGHYCGKCEAAASAPDGGGLAGKWWRAWAEVSGASGVMVIDCAEPFVGERQLRVHWGRDSRCILDSCVDVVRCEVDHSEVVLACYLNRNRRAT